MADDPYNKVFENNRRWVEAKRGDDAQFFSNLAKGQHPPFLYIGCADSRVPETTIMGLDPGDVFVHRNVANLVVNTDSNVGAVVQYAVEHLKVEHVVVCGHYGCGGVQAAMGSANLGTLNGWLRGVRDVYRLHQAELDGIANEDARYRRLVELNVREQCINVSKTSWVQKAIRERGGPQIHGWVYDLATGLLEDLEVPMDAILGDIGAIYRID